MIRILAISFLLVLYTNISYSQEIEKEKVYLLFKENNELDAKSLGYKFKNKKGINFNLVKNAFIHKKKMQKDTLCISHLSNYKITKTEELKPLEKEWRKKNENALKKKYILYRQLDRNAVFDINIIEKINDSQMVIYQVEFRNEGAIP